MKFTPTAIPDVILIEPKLFDDERGYFYESYRHEIFAQNGVDVDFVQDNHVKSSKGVIRALHFQSDPMAQAKLVRCIKGSIYDVAVDIRKGSGTFGQHVGVTLSAENHQMLYVPAGLAHGYCSLDDSEVLYKVSNIYSPEHDGGIIWNDETLAVEWPKLDVPYIVADKDRALPSFKEFLEKSQV